MPIIQHITTAMAEALQGASKQVWDRSLSDFILLQLSPPPDKQVRNLRVLNLFQD